MPHMTLFEVNPSHRSERDALKITNSKVDFEMKITSNLQLYKASILPKDSKIVESPQKLKQCGHLQLQQWLHNQCVYTIGHSFESGLYRGEHRKNIINENCGESLSTCMSFSLKKLTWHQ